MDDLRDAATFPDRHTMRLERRFRASPERLWSAISDPEEMRRWFMVTRFDPAPGAGARFTFEGGWEGTVGRWEPGRFIRFDADEGGSSGLEIEPESAGARFVLWDRLPPNLVVDPGLAGRRAEGADGAGSADGAIDADGAGSAGQADAARLSQPGGPGTHWPGVVAGWHGFVDALEAHLAGQPFEDRYAALCEHYASLLEARARQG